MKKMIGILAKLFTYFCVGTILAMAVGVGSLVSNGQLTKDRAFDLLAVMYDYDPEAPTGGDADSGPPTKELVYENVVNARIRKSLNLDIKEASMEKALLDLRYMDTKVAEEKKRFNDLVDTFKSRLDELENIAKDQALKEVKQTLEVMQPKQAKIQILKMLEDGANGQVIAIIKAMTLDKRKKIFSEFKTDQEQVKLSEILKQIRQGTGQGELVRENKKELESLQQE